MATAGIVVGSVGLLVTPVLVLTAIMLPAIVGGRGLAQRAACAVNLSSIGKGLFMYQADNDYASPPDLQTLMQAQMLSADVLRCPLAKPGRQCDYFYLSPRPVMEVVRPAATIIACDRTGNHPDGGRNVLYVDGHVEWSAEAEFQDALALPCNAAFAAALKKAEGP